MARKTIEELKAAWGGGNKSTKLTNTIKNRLAVKGLDGQAYIIDVTHLQKIQLEAKPTDFAGIADSTTNMTNYFEYEDFIAIDGDNDEPQASINWDMHTILAIPDYKTILATTTVIPSVPSSNTWIIFIAKKPFYMDSGMIVHISLCTSDFVILQAIPSWAIKSVGGIFIQAVRIGQIWLWVQRSTLKMHYTSPTPQYASYLFLL